MYVRSIYELLCSIKQPEFVLATFALANAFGTRFPPSKHFHQTRNINVIDAIQNAKVPDKLLEILEKNAFSGFRKCIR